MESIKLRILEMIEVSSFHGIPNIFRTKRLFNIIIWIFCFVISATACLFFIIQSIISYFSYSHTTSIEIIYEKPLQFPAVSFCSLSSAFNSTNHSLSYLLIECQFDGNTKCFDRPNDTFTWFTDPMYGKCYRFNSGTNMNKNKSIDLFNNSLTGRISSFQLALKEKTGLLVYVHNQTRVPYPFELLNNLNSDSIFTTSGYITDISFERIITQRLGEPYNKCTKDPEIEFTGNKSIINYILKSINRSYDQDYCIQIYFKKYYIQENPCNCSTTIENMWHDCFIVKEKKNDTGCTYLYRSEFFRNFISNADYLNYCPLECDSITYKTSYSFQPFYTYKMNIDYQLNETVKIMVYYREPKYTLITQQPVLLFADLVASIGGIMGINYFKISYRKD
jgi:hypothetical protein